MFKIKFQKLALILFLGIVVFSLTAGCNSLLKTEGGNSQFDGKNENASIQERISNLNKTIKELNEFAIAIDKLEEKYIEINYFAKTKFENADSHSEQVPHTIILNENYQNWINDLSGINVPPSLETIYLHYLESIKQKKLAMASHILKDLWAYDKANSTDVRFYFKSKKEIKSVMKKINKESKILGLPIPYPDYTVITGS